MENSKKVGDYSSCCSMLHFNHHSNLRVEVKSGQECAEPAYDVVVLDAATVSVYLFLTPPQVGQLAEALLGYSIEADPSQLEWLADYVARKSRVLLARVCGDMP